MAQCQDYAGHAACDKLSLLVASFVLFLVSCSITAFSAIAASVHSNWVGDRSVGEVRLISAVTATGDLQKLPLALEFRLAPGWKIYWRTPGEAGLPPEIDILADGNMLASSISWPIPTRFNAFGFDNFGYDTSVILPVEVTGHRRGSAVRLRGQIEALVCADICVPLAGTVALTIPGGIASATVESRAIAKAVAMVPRGAATPLFTIERAWQEESTLHIQFSKPHSIDDIFIEGIEGVAFKKPHLNGTDATIAIEASMPVDLAGKRVTATIVAGDQFAEQSFTITTTSGNTTANDPGWVIFILAWLGGLILNVMPCVLPVLAIKLSTVLKSAGQNKSLVRIRFLSAASGIVASFLILATVLAAMRLAGKQIGWGIQFQSPVFLTLMILLLGVFVLAMFDRLVFPVPAFAQRLTRSVGGDVSLRGQIAGDFLTGMLATILATPCSAPFVGVAVGVAMTGSWSVLFGVFFALGLGLATPWILFILAPGLICVLPQPGPWMGWLKKGLGLLLVGTALWIWSILFAIVGAAMTGTLSAGIVMIIWGLTRHSHALSRPVGIIGAVLALALLTNPSARIALSKTNAAIEAALFSGGSAPPVVWQVWQPAMIGPLVHEGKTVFVDITAAWCITCKANKTLVIEKAPVAPQLRKLVDDGKLVLLQADWTRPNDDIAAFLASYQRYGIPFNIIFGPHAVGGVKLGELLTPDTVLTALRQAMIGP